MEECELLVKRHEELDDECMEIVYSDDFDDNREKYRDRLNKINDEMDTIRTKIKEMEKIAIEQFFALKECSDFIDKAKEYLQNSIISEAMIIDELIIRLGCGDWYE